MTILYECFVTKQGQFKTIRKAIFQIAEENKIQIINTAI